MTDAELWTIEQNLWTGGPAMFASRLADSCVMALPAPAGIIAGRAAIVASIAANPRWSTIEMTERTLVRPASDLVVLAYRATGQRVGAAQYHAYCSSTYRRDERGWQLVQHQQTPLHGMPG